MQKRVLYQHGVRIFLALVLQLALLAIPTLTSAMCILGGDVDRHIIGDERLIELCQPSAASMWGVAVASVLLWLSTFALARRKRTLSLRGAPSGNSPLSFQRRIPQGILTVA